MRIVKLIKYSIKKDQTSIITAMIIIGGIYLVCSAMKITDNYTVYKESIKTLIYNSFVLSWILCITAPYKDEFDIIWRDWYLSLKFTNSLLIFFIDMLFAILLLFFCTSFRELYPNLVDEWLMLLSSFLCIQFIVILMIYMFQSTMVVYIFMIIYVSVYFFLNIQGNTLCIFFPSYGIWKELLFCVCGLTIPCVDSFFLRR